MAKLLGLCLSLSMVCALLIGGARIIGQRQPISRGVAEFHLTECNTPCWIGIIPGQTTISDAKAKIVATFVGQSGLQIKDSGFADGPVYQNAVENTIEGANLSLLIRLNLSPLVDGRSETVQSIGLFDSRGDRGDYAPSVRDILSTFGAPRLFADEETLGLGREITLRYEGFDVVYFTRIDRPPLDEIPRLYLGGNTTQLSPSEFHRWTWASTFSQG